MGIGALFNGLLTGGIIVGKIAQGIASAVGTNVLVDADTGLRVAGGPSAGGIQFF